jgi:hypothetical protein
MLTQKGRRNGKLMRREREKISWHQNRQNVEKCHRKRNYSDGIFQDFRNFPDANTKQKEKWQVDETREGKNQLASESTKRRKRNYLV